MTTFGGILTIQRTKRELPNTTELLLHPEPTFPSLPLSWALQMSYLPPSSTHPHETWKTEWTQRGRCFHSGHAYQVRGSVVLEPGDVMAASCFLSFLSGMAEAPSEGEFCSVVLRVAPKISALSLPSRYFYQPPNNTQ